MTKMEFAAFVGIDWADQEHAVCLRVAGSSKLEESTLCQKPEDLENWALGLRKRFGGRAIAVCLEQSRGALIYILMNYDFLVLFPINPKQSAYYREALAPSGHKNDPFDARTICLFVSEHHDLLRPWRPDDIVTQELKLLNEARRTWVNKRTAACNQLQQRLKDVYPLALELAGPSIHAPSLLGLLEQFPSQRELSRASPKRLARCLRPLRRQEEADPDPRIAMIRAAKAPGVNEAILSANTLAIIYLVKAIALLNKAVDDYDHQIAKLMAKHPEAELFTGLPGAGAAMAPRLAAAWGTDRERFESADQVATWSGIAPIMRKSGKTCIVSQRWICPKFLRQTFHEFAKCSVRQSAWAGACYRMLLKGHKPNAAVRALAFKWIRIIYRCWKDRVPYDEEVHLRNLRKSNSPVLAYLEIEKNTAGA